MATWDEVEASDPEFAGLVRRVFDSRRHKTLATLRRDGSPRISGIEVEFAGGQVLMGMMPGSLKLLDLRRDPRLTVHAASDDPPVEEPSRWAGDAKISGRAVEVQDSGASEEPGNRLRIDIGEVVLTRVGDPADHLLIETWHPGRGLERRKRT